MVPVKYQTFSSTTLVGRVLRVQIEQWKQNEMNQMKTYEQNEMWSTPSLLALRTKWKTYQNKIMNVSISRFAVIIIRADEHTLVNVSHAKLHWQRGESLHGKQIHLCRCICDLAFVHNAATVASQVNWIFLFLLRVSRQNESIRWKYISRNAFEIRNRKSTDKSNGFAQRKFNRKWDIWLMYWHRSGSDFYFFLSTALSTLLSIDVSVLCKKQEKKQEYRRCQWKCHCVRLTYAISPVSIVKKKTFIFFLSSFLFLAVELPIQFLLLASSVSRSVRPFIFSVQQFHVLLFSRLVSISASLRWHMRFCRLHWCFALKWDHE